MAYRTYAEITVAINADAVNLRLNPVCDLCGGEWKLLTSSSDEVHHPDRPDDPLVQCRTCFNVRRALYDADVFAARKGWNDPTSALPQRRAVTYLTRNPPWEVPFKIQHKRRVETFLLAHADEAIVPIKVENWDLSARTAIDDGKVP